MNIFSKAIIDWYKENKRELPWRESSDPYLIWISEIILQQTRVAQGYDYFLRFIKRFPDVQSLADADEDEVMKFWQRSLSSLTGSIVSLFVMISCGGEKHERCFP